MAHSLARLLTTNPRVVWRSATFRSEGVYLTALLFAVCLAFWPLFVGRFYAIGDMRDVFIPLEDFFSQQFRAGALPAWQPQVAWGFPVIAAAQIGFFYPFLLIARFLPLSLYMSLVLLGHIFALAIGMYVWLRTLRQSQLAAMVGSLSFTLSGFYVLHITHFSISLIIAWLPWQLLAAEYLAARAKHRWYHVMSFALLLGVPFLIGQLQIPFLCALFVSFYFLYRSWQSRKKILPVFFFLVVSVMLALGLAAVQLLPTLELVHYSSRGESMGFDLVRANQHSFPLYHVPTLLFPRFFGADSTYWGKRLEIEYGFYIGSIPLLLAVWVAYRRSRQYLFWVLIGLIAFLLALGGLSPFRFIGLEPSLWYFSAPARWLLFTTLALAVLAGYGVDLALQQVDSVKKFLNKCIALILGITVLFNILLSFRTVILTKLFKLTAQVYPTVFAGRPIDYYHAKLSQLADSLVDSSLSFRSPYTLVTLLALLLALLCIGRIRTRPLLMVIVAMELVVLAATATPSLPWRTILEPPQAILKNLPPLIQNSQARIYGLNENGDTGAFLTNPASRPNAAIREQQNKLLLPLRHVQYGISGVIWPASLDFTAQSTALASLSENNIFNTTQAASLNIGALLLPATRTLPVPNSPATPIDGVILHTFAPAARAALRVGDTAESPLVYTAPQPGKIIIEADSSAAAQVIIRDTWYPGWTAIVNGVAVPVLREAPFFMAVPVSTGHSHIELTFSSQSLRLGLTISIIAGLVIGLALLARTVSYVRHMLG